MSDQNRQTSGYSSMRREIGAKIESRMCQKYKLNLDHPGGGKADASHSNGVPVEIKSALREKADGRGGSREGVFKIFRGSHEYVRNRKGYYIFCCYTISRSEKVRIQATKKIPASRLPYFEWGDPSSNPNRDYDQMALFKISDIF